MGFLAKKPVVAGAALATTRQLGQSAEDSALHYLQAAGLRLVERNYRTPGRGGGEIDLIMRDAEGTLVFVEVRSRSREDYGGAGTSITATKQARIVRAARYFLRRCSTPPACRFDVVLIAPGRSVQWLRAAFDAQ